MSNPEQINHDLIAATKQVLGGKFPDLAINLAEQGKLDALRPVLDVIIPDLPKSGAKAKEFFLAILAVIETASDRDAALDLARDVADRIGFSTDKLLNKLLGELVDDRKVARLMKFGVNPNGVATKTAKQSVTSLGAALLDISASTANNMLGPRLMIEEIARRNEIPVTVIKHEKGLDRKITLFEHLLYGKLDTEPVPSRIPDKAFSITVAAMKFIEPRESWTNAIGRAFIDPWRAPEMLSGSRIRGLLNLLSYATFESPGQLKQVLGSEIWPRHVGSDIVDLGYPDFDRFISRLTDQGIDVDAIKAQTNADAIPCTMLQLAAMCGKDEYVKRLLETGADASLKVGAQSETYQIADMDALALWNSQGDRPANEALLAWKAKHAIESTLRKAGVRP